MQHEAAEMMQQQVHSKAQQQKEFKLMKTTKRAQANEDMYIRIRQLICLNLFLFAVYLVVQIVKSFK